MKCYSISPKRFTTTIIFSLAISGNALALEIGPIAEITHTNPEIRFLASDVDRASWELETQSTGYFEISVNGSTNGYGPFKIHKDAWADSLTLDENGNVGVGGEDPQIINKLEVFGGTSSNSAAIAITPSTFSPGKSARLSVDRTANEFAINTRTIGSNPYLKPFVVDLGAPSNAIAISASGNVGINTTTPMSTLEVNGDVVVSGTIAIGSSRDIKHGFETVEPNEVLRQLLKIPITKWSYNDGEPNVRHIGPISQDFSAAFGVGRDNKHVSPVDLSGVAFAAIQGLYKLVIKRESEITTLRQSQEKLRQSRDDLSARIEALEKLVIAQNTNIDN